MQYRAPIKGKNAPKVRTSTLSTFMPRSPDLTDSIFGGDRVKQLIHELEGLKTTYEVKIEAIIAKAKGELERAQRIARGDRGPKGENGKNGRDGNDGAPGKDGREIDEERLTQRVLKRIPKPVAGRDGKNAESVETDPMSIVDLVFEKLEKGERKIKGKNIDGFEQTMRAFSNQLGRGYLHGGGDTLVAGSGVTLTPNSNGTKTITATGGSTLNPQQPSGTINSVNTVFTCVGLVTVAFRDGVPDPNAVITGATNSTITYSAPPQEYVFAF